LKLFHARCQILAILKVAVTLKYRYSWARTMPTLPTETLFEDRSLRDGLQIEKRLISVDERQQFIPGLEERRVHRTQVGSYTHSKWVSQMADTDELFARLNPGPGIVQTALVIQSCPIPVADGV
jgi:hypothetical protein